MTSITFPRGALRVAYQLLLKQHGPQSWWPGDSPFEVMVGAVLTQNTAWSNVEKAIQNLKSENALQAKVIVGVKHEKLAKWIRSSGYFNIKAKRLRNFCRWYLDQGGLGKLQRSDTNELREGLLSVNGIGPETADDMLLYAFGRPVFVVDAYTRRIFQRLGFFTGEPPYEVLRASIEQVLTPDVALYNEYHALIVMHGKDICRPKPLCLDCGLKKRCSYYRTH